MNLPFFLEMAWKSALIAGAALSLAALLKSRAAADRAAILRLAAGLLLLLPLVSLLLPALQVEMAAASQEAKPALPYFMPAAEALPIDGAQLAIPSPATQDDPAMLIAILYLGGLLMVGARLGAGLWMLRRWTRDAVDVRSPEWTAALERVRAASGVSPHLRLLVSDEAPSPLSWGWLRPVILIDRDSLDRPEDADAILAHEIAHVARRDWPALMASRLAVGLFWFNPLVWLLERQFVQQVEEAADSQAVGRVEPAQYAQTLLGCAQQAWASPLPANSIASRTGLGRRVKAVLDGRSRMTPGSKWTMAAMAATVALAAPVAALELTEAKAPPRAPAAPVAPLPPAPPAPLALVSMQAPAAPEAPAVPTPPVAPKAPEAGKAGYYFEGRYEPLTEADRAEIEAAVEAAAEAGEIAAASAERAVEQAMRHASLAMASGAASMEAGANGMEAGARQMLEESRKLRRRDYREQQIAKSAARGETVSHEELLEAADELEEGSREMVEGAREMRRAAAEMRDQH